MPRRRRADERALRQHQGGPRGAARPRPDLPDRASQLLTRRTGGWPLTMFLTPGRRSRSSAAPTSRRTTATACPAFATLLARVARRLPRAAPDRIARDSAAALARAMPARSPAAARRGTARATPAIAAGARGSRGAFDRDHGGFGGAPKFPHPTDLEFLLRACARTATRRRSTMVRTHARRAWRAAASTTTSAAASTATRVDADWLVPHFEKMLYDNAQLLAPLRGRWRA